MLTFASFVVLSFMKFWKCGLSGVIAQLLLIFLVIGYFSRYCEFYVGFNLFLIIVAPVWIEAMGWRTVTAY